jgi:uncharacterized protein YukE
MPIDIKIEGNPDSIRATARWLRGTLSEGIHDATTQVHAARTNTEADWTGEAADGFRSKMATGGQQADDLAGDADTAGQSFERYADDLQTAQTRMARAKQIAIDGGLQVTDTQILDPGPAPANPGTLPADATPAQQTAHGDAVKATQLHAKQVAAFNAASTEANGAKSDLSFARDTFKNISDEVTKKPYFQAAALADATFAASAAQRFSTRLAADARIAGNLAAKAGVPGAVYRGVPGSDVGRALRTQAGANQWAARAAKGAKVARAFGGRLPLIGTGVAVVSAGYDIAHGKPPGKAVVSTAAGIGAGIAVGAAVGSVVPVAGTAVGAVVGAGAGLIASGAVDAAWDRLPKGVTGPIDNGLSAAGRTVGGGVKKAWNSIF